MTRTREPVHALLACALLVAAGCEKEAPPPVEVVRPIKMLDVGGGSGQTREYPGRIRAGQQVNAAFEVSGRIIEWTYNEGSRVEEGSVLAKLDPRDYRNQLDQARAALKNARTQLDRIAQAHKTRAVSDQDLSNAEAQVDVAAAEVRIKRKALDDTELRAPFDGVMSRKLVEDFANVQAKEAVLVFEDPSHLEIKVSVPERDLAGRQRPDETSEELNARINPVVVVSALPDQPIEARVKELATTADPTTRTYQATFLFDRPADTSILPGMTAKVIVTVSPEAGEQDALRIPVEAAVADPSGQATVWLVDPATRTVRRQPVRLGNLTDDGVLVDDGLSPGDVIAISGIAQLREGMEVRRWELPGAGGQ